MDWDVFELDGYDFDQMEKIFSHISAIIRQSPLL